MCFLVVSTSQMGSVSALLSFDARRFLVALLDALSAAVEAIYLRREEEAL